MKPAVVTLLLAASLVFAGASWAYLPLTHDAAQVTMSADTFARALAGTANEFGGPQLVNVHCVQGDPGDYMCSYGVVRRGRMRCHLMQGHWSADTGEIQVTLAGQTKRCRTLRDAVHSLD